MTVFIDNLISQLWESKNQPNSRRILRKHDIKMLCGLAISIFQEQPVFLELIPPITVCGDVHGQFFDLLRIFEIGGKPETSNYLFLGDYVDRGYDSINTVCLLFAYKIKYPNNFFLLRGNHESSIVNKEYGFYAECRETYGVSTWYAINKVFEWLPISASIGSRILCLHGGISPDFNCLPDLFGIQRPLEIPDKGLLCDVLWSDPDPSVESWGPSDRQISMVFGYKPVKEITSKLEIDLIIRAHQVTEQGYEFPFQPNNNLLTLFSAPSYSGLSNNGALLHISKDLICTFSIIENKCKNS